MKKKRLAAWVWIVIILLIILIGFILIVNLKGKERTDEESKIGLANPASVYCVERGNKLEIRTDATGGQYGVCILPDGKECEEWEYFENNGAC
ncbi:MAG: DUF333 domain-containing protein [Candidatus Pacearchaeota archaeon]